VLGNQQLSIAQCLISTSKLPKFKIVNISCLLNFNIKLDLNYLELFLENAKLDQSPLNTLIVKINGVTILLFKSGKAIISGAKKKKQAYEAALILVENLKNSHYENAKLKLFKVTNLVISTHLGCGIDIERFYDNNKKNSSYEIELFPGLIFKEYKKISATIFRRGSFFVTGFSNFRLARKYIISLYERLLKFAIK